MLKPSFRYTSYNETTYRYVGIQIWRALLDVNHVGYPCPKTNAGSSTCVQKTNACPKSDACTLQRVSKSDACSLQQVSNKRCVLTTTRVQKAMRVHHQRAFIDAVQKAICVSKMDANGAKWPKIDSKWTQMDTFQ